MTTKLKDYPGELHIRVMFISDPHDDDAYSVAKQTIVTEQLLEYAVLPAREMATKIFQDLFNAIWNRRAPRATGSAKKGMKI